LRQNLSVLSSSRIVLLALTLVALFGCSHAPGSIVGKWSLDASTASSNHGQLPNDFSDVQEFRADGAFFEDSTANGMKRHAEGLYQLEGDQLTLTRTTSWTELPGGKRRNIPPSQSVKATVTIGADTLKMDAPPAPQTYHRVK
jgi:hypothetical protein